MPRAQLPLVSEQGIWKDRDTVDSLPFFLNGYFEKTDSPYSPSYKFAFVKRPGLKTLLNAGFTAGHRIAGLSSRPSTGTGGNTALVIFTQNGTVNRAWYYDNTSGLVDRLAQAGWTTEKSVVFSILDGVSYGTDKYWVATDFTKAALIDNSGNWTDISDADFTGLTLRTNIVGMNGYLYVGASNSRIYNSDLNTGTAWTSTSFLTAAFRPGDLRWLAVLRNFLIVFKENSIEFFEDVGNPTPGSPLEPRLTLNRDIGLVNRSTVQEVSDGIIFVGQANDGKVQKVYKILRDSLDIVPISSRYVEQCLPSVIPGVGVTISGTYSADAIVQSYLGTGSDTRGQSQVFTLNGKEFYTVNTLDPKKGSKIYTQVYDNNLKMWTTWDSPNSTLTNVYGFLGSQSCPFVSSTLGRVTVFVDNSTVKDSAGAARLVAMRDDVPEWLDRVAGFDTNYAFSCVTEPLDFGSNKRKFLDSFEVIYDMRNDGTPNTASATTLTLTHYDWDYNPTSAYKVARTLYIDENHGTRCIARRLGSFRRRSYKLSATHALPMRIWGMELQYNQGETDQEG